MQKTQLQPVILAVLTNHPYKQITTTLLMKQTGFTKVQVLSVMRRLVEQNVVQRAAEGLYVYNPDVKIEPAKPTAKQLNTNLVRPQSESNIETLPMRSRALDAENWILLVEFMDGLLDSQFEGE